MAMLVWSTAEGGREYALGEVTRIGRAEDNDVQLVSPRASSHHATLRHERGLWILEDNHSTNGTLANGRRISRQVLQNEDAVAIGGLTLVFRAAPQAGLSTLFFSHDEATGAAPAAAPSSTDDEGEPGALRDSVFRDSDAIRPLASAAIGDAVEEAPSSSSALARRWRATWEISRAAAATLDLRALMDRVLGALFEIFGASDRAVILLVDPATQAVKSAAVRRRTPDDTEEITMSRTALQEAMTKRHALLCADTRRDGLFAAAQSVVALGIRSMMVAPLIFQDEVFGAIYIDSRQQGGRFTQSDLELLSVAARQVGGCVANARLHDQVLQAERLAAVGETVAGLAHCIKSVLQGVKGGEYLLDKALSDEHLPGVRSGWDMVKRNNAFLDQLVRDLLTYSRPRQPECQPADLNALCREVCESLAAHAEAKNVCVAFRPADDLPQVELDPTGIRRVLFNLVANGLDACEQKGGRVDVATHREGAESVRIEVADDGCGMSEEVCRRLFTVFFTTKRSRGTGLGLPVSKKIVEEHGGKIAVASREGEATTFTVSLPVRRAAQN